ncbi:hypothetical protein [Branchiibius hedensis]|uniref:hypothetical protein n=1 Tax=Branchiibius hedensis TaxID=672460 RepID=UPI000D6C1383|nr:hypothetical protein [Branchiibius hedensis]
MSTEPAVAETPLSLLSATAATGVAVLLALLTPAGPVWVGIGVLLVGLVLASGWPALSPSQWGIREVVAIGAVLIAACGIRSDAGGHPHWLALALAGSLVLAFLVQLLRPDGRSDVVGSLGSCALAFAVLACGGLAPFAAARPHAVPVAWTVAIGVVASVLTRSAVQRTSLDLEWAVPVAMVVGGIGGVVIAGATGLAWNRLLLIGMLAAALAHAVRRVLLTAAVRDRLAQIAVGVAIALSGGMIAYAATWWLNR